MLTGALTSAAVGSKLERGWGTTVAVPSHHVGATLALAAVWVTHGAEGALRVTLALWEMESKHRKHTVRPHQAVTGPV